LVLAVERTVVPSLFVFQNQTGVHIVHENLNGLARVLAGRMICQQGLDQARLLPLMRAKIEAIILLRKKGACACQRAMAILSLMCSRSIAAISEADEIIHPVNEVGNRTIHFGLPGFGDLISGRFLLIWRSHFSRSISV
jgi:hypothetical protein